MSYETDKEQREVLSAEDENVIRLLGSLKKTDAPADFDFRLKARLANAKPVPATSGYGWLPRLVLPVAAVFAIGAFFVLGGLFRNDVGDMAINEVPALEKTVVPQINEPELPEDVVKPLASPANSGQNAVTRPAANAPVERPAISDTNINRRERVADLSRAEKDDEGGSLDSSVGPPTEARRPTGLNPQAPSTSAAGVNQNAIAVTVREVLSVNGIEVELDGGKWIVRSVTPNGVGESSGVRRNDVIEAINDQPINSATVFTKSLSGKSITVTRGGASTKIMLRTRP